MGDKSDEDLKFCPMLSAALSRIIKHTANDEFRDECFKMLKTNNSLGAQIALTAKLSSIASQFTEKRNKRKKTMKKNTKYPADDKT